MKTRFCLLFLLLVTSSFGQAIQPLLDAIECDRRDIVGNIQLVVDTEAKDRQNYKPLSAEVTPIRMRKPAQGYHGPTQGSYILVLEKYASEKDAERRALEYRGEWWKRIPDPTVEEKEAKSSVRCWAIAEGAHVYLLTTHAVTFSALEAKTNDIKRKLTAYLVANRDELVK